MCPAYSTYLALPTGPMPLVVMISENPMIEFSGVRSSWLMLARNSDFA